MSLEKNIHNDGAVVVGMAQGFPFPFTTVGAWEAGDFWMVMGRNAYNVAIENKLKPDGESHFGDELTDQTWVNIYYKLHRQDDANKAAALFADPEKVSHPAGRLMRVFFCSKDDMLPVGNFNNTFAIAKQAFGGRGQWQPFSLVTLPSIVWAYAKHQGWDVPDMTFSELSDTKNMTIRPNEVAGVWERLTQQRADLWQALGEDNYKIQAQMGAKDLKGQPMTGTTASEKLSKALNFAQSRWSGIYAAVGQVGDPGNPKGRIPVVNHFFETKEDAATFVAERSTQTAAEGDVVSSPAKNQWADLFVADGLDATEMAEAVASSVVELLATLEAAEKPMDKAKAKKALENVYVNDFGMTVEQGAAWVTALKTNGIL
jgi:hypothetical protein